MINQSGEIAKLELSYRGNMSGKWNSQKNNHLHGGIDK